MKFLAVNEEESIYKPLADERAVGLFVLGKDLKEWKIYRLCNLDGINTGTMVEKALKVYS